MIFEQEGLDERLCSSVERIIQTYYPLDLRGLFVHEQHNYFFLVQEYLVFLL